MVANELILLHDKLLTEKPEGASHDEATCPLCALEDDPEGGAMSFTQEDLDAAVASAVKPLEEKIAQFSASQEEVEIENRISEATTPLKETIEKLQADLDVATLEVTTSKEALTNTVAYLEQVETDTAAEAEKATLRESRIAKVKEVAPTFPEDRITASADRWAGMAEEDFDAMLDEWRSIATEKVEVKTEGEIPEKTAMTATADTDKKPEGDDLIRGFHDKVLAGFDPKRV